MSTSSLLSKVAFRQLVVTLLIAILTNFAFAQPFISSFSPRTGNIGTTVVISGNNFSSTPANNIVYFGDVRASVISATGTSLNVTVPAGASYQPITVTVNGFTAFSRLPFVVTFPGGGAITNSSFNNLATYNTGDSPYDVSTGDVDGDGKPDLVVVNGGFPYSVSVYRNLSIDGNMSFAAPVDLPTALVPYNVAIGDLDGDGKPELVIANSGSHTLSILKNNSTPGTVSFEPAGSYATGTDPNSIAIGELDGDGKPDLAVANLLSNTLSLFRNTSTGGVISFASKVDFATGQYPGIVTLGDWDNDGLSDVGVLHDTGIWLFRNTSSVGIFSLATRLNYPVGALVRVDLDGDGKADMATSNGTGGISVYRNAGMPGVINFEARIDIPVVPDGGYITAADMDGDGKVDLAISNQADSVAVIRNTSTSGNLSFVYDQANFYMTEQLATIKSADLDGDGRPELITSSIGTNIVAVLRNTITAPGVISFTPKRGPVGTAVTITGNNFTGATAVSFGDQPSSSFTVVSATTITATVGAGNSGKVKVTTASGTGSLGEFVFLAAPAITSFTPTIGATGTVINITGTALSEATAVSFGGTPAASFTIVSPTSIAAIIAAGNSGNVSVTTPYGTATAPGFTYKPPQAIPVITSFSPASGSPGSIVTINGNNFSAVSTENTVYFGAARGNVITSTTTMIQVRVPLGATYDPITATIGTLTAYSPKAFSTTFAGFGTLTTSSMEPFKTFLGGTISLCVAIGDIDGDGKLDIMSVSGGSLIAVLRNTGSVGSLSFAPKIEFPTGFRPNHVTTGDIDSDGKLDMIVANEGGSASVLRNTSTPGNISFDPTIELQAINNCSEAAVVDFDGDGRPDIVVANAGPGRLSVFKNTTIGSTISFEPKIDFVAGTDPFSNYSLSVGDLDGDGKPDMAAVDYSHHKVATFRNTTVNGSISFAPKVDIACGMNPRSVSIRDLDADGKPELIIASSDILPLSLSIARNTSVPGTISFATNVDLQTAATPMDISINDIDGDGKPDIIIPFNAGDNGVSVFRNKSSINSIAFEPRIDYFLNYEINALSVAAGDMDNDGKPDIVTTDFDLYPNRAFISIFRNAMAEPKVVASGANPVSGFVAKQMFWDATVQTFHGSPYVQRHYDINPENNASTATGTVTLYFTQQDFNNFNAHPAHGLRLPTDYWDFNGRSYLRVFQYHGTVQQEILAPIQVEQ